jgi:HK97 family phage major capsid protein
VPGLDGIIRRDIEMAIAHALETAAINGSGTGSQPTGILNDGNIGVEAIGANGGAPDWGNIVALEANVANDNADFGRLGYLTTPGMRGLMKTVEKASNTAQFIWDNGPLAGVTNTIGEGQLNGYRAAISSLVPSELEKGTGYNLHAIIFGNWADLLMGQFGGLDIVVDPYTQATNTLLRIVVNSWWDIAIRHSASFAAIKDASAGEFNT